MEHCYLLATQYMHIVEKDSVPLVFFSSKPISPDIQQTEQTKPTVESRMYVYFSFLIKQKNTIYIKCFCTLFSESNF